MPTDESAVGSALADAIEAKVSGSEVPRATKVIAVIESAASEAKVIAAWVEEVETLSAQWQHWPCRRSGLRHMAAEALAAEPHGERSSVPGTSSTHPSRPARSPIIAVTIPISMSATTNDRYPSHIIVGGHTAKRTFQGTVSAWPM